VKALAARTSDINDIRLLAGMIGVDSVEAALQVCRDFFPDEVASPRTVAVPKSFSAEERTPGSGGHRAAPRC
jgi:hypothetical protein